ncbi:transglycosylase family protein [Ferrimicrobium sp.]|uniref:transglycosylase family protein n=1 Tax=Ferrimicrobium sp. TaxID=2926050 RepID=UPI002623E3EF|nr:transglycosylase family protein [Ferrimicrobium sp.]
MKEREGRSSNGAMPARTLAKGIAFTAGLLGLALLPGPPVALTSATQATLQVQAAQISQQIAVQSAQVRTVALQASAARAQLASDRANLARLGAELSQARSRIADERRLLVRYAVTRFTDAPGSSSVIGTLNTNQNNVIAQTAYESVASGYIVSIITAYSRDQQTISSLIASDARAVAMATQAQQTFAQDLASLQTGVANEQASLASIHGQMAQLVQQQLAQAAARQAAALAARQAAALAARQAAVQSQSQGAPSAAGVSAAVTTGAAGTKWGGTPAPPSPQAFAALRECESGGNYQDNTGNGYYGAYQFSLATWSGLGFSGLPSAASPSTQDQAAQIEQRQSGWSAWPECSLILGLN